MGDYSIVATKITDWKEITIKELMILERWCNKGNHYRVIRYVDSSEGLIEKGIASIIEEQLKQEEIDRQYKEKQKMLKDARQHKKSLKITASEIQIYNELKKKYETSNN